MNMYREIVYMLAYMMKQANMEPNTATVSIVSNLLKPVFDRYGTLQADAEMAPFIGTAWQAIELAIMDGSGGVKNAQMEALSKLMGNTP
jgi:hypothetical protein